MSLLPRLSLRTYWPWLGLLIGLVFAGAFGAGAPGIARVEASFFDFLQSTQPAEVRDDPTRDPIALVGIDDETYESTSQDPRELYVQAIRTILAAKPHVLAIDLEFEGRDRAADGIAAALDAIRKRSLAPAAALDSIRADLDPDRRLVDTLSNQPTIVVFYANVEPGAHDDFSTVPPEWKASTRSCENLPQALAVNRLHLPYLPVEQAVALGGNADLPTDPDGIVRRYPLYSRLGTCPDCVYPSLAAAAVQAVYQEQDNGGDFNAEVARTYGGVDCGASLDAIVGMNIGSFEDIPHDAFGDLRIDFRKGFEETFPNWIPIGDIALGKIAPERFTDKAVFMGAKSDYVDHFATPTAPKFPGFGIHALVAQSLLTNHFLRRSDGARAAEGAAMLLCGLAVTLLFVLSDPGGWPLIGAVLLPMLGFWLSREFLTGAPILGVHLFRGGSLVDALVPGLTGAIALLGCTGARFVVERQARQQSERELGRFLSPSVVDIALKNPELLKPARKEITILFSDIRGFTTTSEGMTPDALAELLNQYLSRMTDIVFQFKGTLDKYIGDAVMALYGAPLEYEDHPAMACRSALEMFRALAKLQEQWKAEGRPVLKIGVGINTGVVSVGRMGSSAKSEYTCIGDEVNFASRVEGLTKAYGVHILVGENTRNRVGDEFVFRDIGPVRVKGKKKSVRVYELVGTRAEIPDVRWVVTFEQAMERFRARDWDGTDALLAQAIQERGGEDAPSKAVMTWTGIFRQRPPEADWDGTIERREK